MFLNQFGRLITACITPFREDLTIDYPGLENLLEHLLRTGSDSVLITGTTGENPTLTHNEEWELLKNTKAILKGRASVLFGAGSNCTRTAVEVSVKAEELGADGLLSVAPYYNKPNQEGIYEHFSAVAKAVKIPVMLYNNPGRTCSFIEPETLAKLNSEHKNIYAVKESSGSLDTLSQFRIKCPDVEIYCGDDNLILPSLTLGAKGAVSVASHIAGKQLKEMLTKFLDGKIEEAAKIHFKLYPLFKACFASPSPGPVKYALSELGLCNPHLRLPLTPPAQSVRDSLNQILISLKDSELIGFSS